MYIKPNEYVGVNYGSSIKYNEIYQPHLTGREWGIAISYNDNLGVTQKPRQKCNVCTLT